MRRLPYVSFRTRRSALPLIPKRWIGHFLRKVIRKLLFFLLEPMSQDAIAFNIASVRAVEQLTAFAREQVEENAKNLRRIEALEKRIDELEKK